MTNDPTRTQVPQGNKDSRELMDDWRRGQGNTKDSNFTTPGDRANPGDFTEDLAERGEDNYPEAK